MGLADHGQLGHGGSITVALVVPGQASARNKQHHTTSHHHHKPFHTWRHRHTGHRTLSAHSAEVCQPIHGSLLSLDLADRERFSLGRLSSSPQQHVTSHTNHANHLHQPLRQPLQPQPAGAQQRSVSTITRTPAVPPVGGEPLQLVLLTNQQILSTLQLVGRAEEKGDFLVLHQNYYGVWFRRSIRRPTYSA